jgi:hypothetical protein
VRRAAQLLGVPGAVREPHRLQHLRNILHPDGADLHPEFLVAVEAFHRPLVVDHGNLLVHVYPPAARSISAWFTLEAMRSISESTLARSSPRTSQALSRKALPSVGS